MLTVRDATGPETDTWREGWRARLGARFARYTGPGAADLEIERVVAGQRPGTVHTVEIDGAPAGRIAFGAPGGSGPGSLALHDLWLAPGHRGHGHGRAALTWARGHAAATGATRLAVAMVPDGGVLDALFDGYQVRAQNMVKNIGGPIALPAGVTGRTMTADDFAPWRAAAERGYAAEIADSGLLTADEARERAAQQFGELLPDGAQTAGHSFWTVEAAGTPVGTIWLRHGLRPGCSFVFDVDIDPAHRGRGYGRAAMLVGEEATVAAGDAQLGLNVFGHNTVARRLYESMGYEIVEQYRSADL